MQTEIVIPEPIICNNVTEYPHINLHYLSQHAIDAIHNHYKNDTILIKYAMEIVNYDGYEADGAEIEIIKLNIIIHDRYEFDKNTNIFIPIYRYDTFIQEHVISRESIPNFHIDTDFTKYSNVIDNNLFA
jgi:hypothetical protein